MTSVRATVSSGTTQRLTCVLLLLVLATGMLAPSWAIAQSVQASGVDDWRVYGTVSVRGRDSAVPGTGIVAAKPRAQAGEAWYSGAFVQVPGSIASGERITAVFWARAAQPEQLSLQLQSGEPDYVHFATAKVMLTPTWQQVSVSGTAPRNFAAGSQFLSVPLGRAKSEVTLGPVAFLRGEVDGAAMARAFAGYRPTAVPVDVRIASEQAVILAGTLHLPVQRGKGPFPLAILIQGHGPNGRGGYSEVIKRLTADGIAALEYDKRGIGQSTGTYKEDSERLTADAVAAVAAMRRRPEIKGDRIALIGHSQGGVIAPAVAAADPTIATVVTLAGSVGDGLPYLRRAISSQLAFAGRPEAVVAPAVDAAMTLLQARIDGQSPEAIAPLRATVVDRFQAAGFTRPQAENALALIDTEEAQGARKLRSASDLRSLRIPVLAVFGTKDPLVIASGEAPAAGAVLASNPRSKVVVLDGLSHWFQEGANTGGQEEVATLGPNLGSPRVVTLIGDWLRDMLVSQVSRADRPTR